MTVLHDADLDDDWEDFPEAGGGRRFGVAIAICLFVLVSGLGAAGAGVLWFQSKANPPGGPGEEIAVTIPMGSSSVRIGELLEAEGVISDARAFRIWLRLNPTGQFQAGDYNFARNSPFDVVAAQLEQGPELVFETLTIPEGFTLEQVAARVGELEGRSAERFLELAGSGEVTSSLAPPGTTNLEGLLFPDTYSFEAKDDEKVILQRMVTAMEEVTAELGIGSTRADLSLSPYEAIVMASLVEREIQRPEERAKAARVMYNRLEDGIPLGIDASLDYALGEPAVRQSQLETKSPYNLRQVKGLPPTPIAMPGRAALEAAIDPEPGDWLYYVKTDVDGSHFFTSSYNEFLRAKADAQRRGVF